MHNMRSFKTSLVTALLKDLTLTGLKPTFGNYNQEFVGTLLVRLKNFSLTLLTEDIVNHCDYKIIEKKK